MYMVSLFLENAHFYKRLADSVIKVSLHSQAIYVPADDLTDPAPATTFAHLDATTVLSRGIAELGIYPAVDPLDSTSRILDANIIGEEHYAVARGVQKVLQVPEYIYKMYLIPYLLVYMRKHVKKIFGTGLQLSIAHNRAFLKEIVLQSYAILLPKFDCYPRISLPFQNEIMSLLTSK